MAPLRRRRSAFEAPRTGSAAAWLVVGLANPGSTYAGTRHNVGGDAVVLLAARHGAGSLKVEKGQRASTTTVTIANQLVALAVPTTYMNESGAALPPLEKRFSVSAPTSLIIVHDELDLEPGVVRVKAGGGLAGHNGLRSITSALDTQEYLRVRIGIGKPPSADKGASYVLSKLSGSTAQLLATATAVAADAVEAIVTDGVHQAMTRFNQ